MNPSYNSNSQQSNQEETTTSTTSNCIHYQRGCDIIADCCQRQYPCRLCHDQSENHPIDRHATKQIVCRECGQQQPVSNQCQQCGKKFGDYYCEVCRLWDSSGKSIFHCDGCGICRVGKGLGIDYFHCNKCNSCLPIKLQDSHQCVENTLHGNCPICHEDMFQSTTPCIHLDCGHSIHRDCLSEYTKHHYQCPICKKSIQKMDDYWRRLDVIKSQRGDSVPAEYQNWEQEILCQDCLQKSIIPFDIDFHQCPECHGYNINIINTIPPKSNEQTTD